MRAGKFVEVTIPGDSLNAGSRGHDGGAARSANGSGVRLLEEGLSLVKFAQSMRGLWRRLQLFDSRL